MARIINLALQVADVLKTYSAVHEELVGSSLRRLVSIAGLGKPVDYSELEQCLEDLESRLAAIRTELGELPAEELTKRAKDDVRSALDRYAQKLANAIGKLRVICRKIGQAERSGAGRAAYSTEELNVDKVAYDCAVQEYKRYGIRLNQLLSTF